MGKSDQVRKIIDKISEEVDKVSESELANDPAMRSILSAVQKTQWALSEVVSYVSSYIEQTQNALEKMEQTQKLMLGEIKKKNEKRTDWWMDIVKGVLIAVAAGAAATVFSQVG